MTESISYAGYPETIGERRQAMNMDASDWTPRDALVQTLRRIDEGANITDMVVCWREKHPGMEDTAHFRNATQDQFVAIGLLALMTVRLTDRE